MVPRFRALGAVSMVLFLSPAYRPGRIGNGDQTRLRCPEFPALTACRAHVYTSFSRVILADKETHTLLCSGLCMSGSELGSWAYHS